jgi:hypothetical protein
MSDTVDAIAHKADLPSRMQDAVSHRVNSVRAAVTGTVGDVRSRIGDMSGALPDPGALRAKAFDRMNDLRDSPLALFLGCVALGFTIGMMLPRTDAEDDRIGRLSHRLKQTARNRGTEMARDLMRPL